MFGPMTSAMPDSAAAPSAPPVADGVTAEVGTAQPEVARQSRWRAVGLVVVGLLIVLYGMLVISLRPSALGALAVLAGIALIAGGVAQIALAGELERRWRWLGYLGGLVGVAASGRELLLMVNLIGVYLIIPGLDTAVSALRGRRLPDLR